MTQNAFGSALVFVHVFWAAQEVYTCKDLHLLGCKTLYMNPNFFRPLALRPHHFFTSHFLCHEDAIELSEGHAFVEESGVVLVLVEVIAVLAIPRQAQARGICIVVEVDQAQQLFVKRRPLCTIGVVLDSDLVPPWLIR